MYGIMLAYTKQLLAKGFNMYQGVRNWETFEAWNMFFTNMELCGLSEEQLEDFLREELGEHSGLLGSIVSHFIIEVDFSEFVDTCEEEEEDDE